MARSCKHTTSAPEMSGTKYREENKKNHFQHHLQANKMQKES